MFLWVQKHSEKNHCVIEGTTNQEMFGNLRVSFFRKVLLHTLFESIQLSPAFIVPIPPYLLTSTLQFILLLPLR